MQIPDLCATGCIWCRQSEWTLVSTQLREWDHLGEREVWARWRGKRKNVKKQTETIRNEMREKWKKGKCQEAIKMEWGRWGLRGNRDRGLGERMTRQKMFRREERKRGRRWKMRQTTEWICDKWERNRRSRETRNWWVKDEKGECSCRRGQRWEGLNQRWAVWRSSHSQRRSKNQRHRHPSITLLPSRHRWIVNVWQLPDTSH